MMRTRLVMLLAIWTVAGLPTTTLAGERVKLTGYLDYRKGSFLIVDAQRVQVGTNTQFKGNGRATSIQTIPIGYEMKVKGMRLQNGTVAALEIEARRNGIGSTEKQIVASTDKAEKTWVQAKQVVEPGPDGKQVSMGALHDSGPQVERARKIVNRILPAQVNPMKVRVYVVDNKEWNAMAMANYSIYVFSGLMADMDDDEMAIVLGHELAHATYEHSRRQASKSQITGIAGQAAALGAGMIKNETAKSAAQQATVLSVTTFGNAFSREYEDQADRVGLRYVYEAGYDYTKAPQLWRRFAAKYGDQDQVTNFFFGNHSLSTKRAAALEKEIANNYRNPADLPSKAPK
ncbi:MAG: M48 family metalloprotease [Acidobacteria bacterium]|nr:M48 family metalloprotease [Acidobacteriota bacterium]